MVIWGLRAACKEAWSTCASGGQSVLNHGDGMAAAAQLLCLNERARWLLLIHWVTACRWCQAWARRRSTHTAATQAAWNRLSGRGMVAFESTGVCSPPSPASTAAAPEGRPGMGGVNGCSTGRELVMPAGTAPVATPVAAPVAAVAGWQWHPGQGGSRILISWHIMWDSSDACTHPHAQWAAPLP